MTKRTSDAAALAGCERWRAPTALLRAAVDAAPATAFLARSQVGAAGSRREAIER